VNSALPPEFPSAPADHIPNHPGTTEYGFYGADIRDSGIEWFLDQLRRIAAVPASDEDDDRVVGLFLVRHEVDGAAQWHVRDGQVFVTAADPTHQYLDV